MNRRLFLKNISFASAGISLGVLSTHLQAAENILSLTILHTNDMHCHIEPFSEGHSRHAGKGGLAKISEMVKQIRNQNANTLLFDSGDMFQGTPYFNYFKGELMLKIMSSMGYDAGTLGNHEFDNGLEGILSQLPNAKFPIINSNYDFTDTILADRFKPWKTFKRNGIKVGVYALGIELEGLVFTKNFGNTIYHDPVKVAQKTETFLKHEKHCDLVICLSHLGYEYHDGTVSDRVLASQTSFTDVILGGHTHTFLNEPVQIKNTSGNPVLVSQAGWGGLMLGRIDFTFEREKRKAKNAFAQNLMS